MQSMMGSEKRTKNATPIAAKVFYTHIVKANHKSKKGLIYKDSITKMCNKILKKQRLTSQISFVSEYCQCHFE